MDLNLDAEQLIGSVIKSTLFGRGKRARRVGRLVSKRGGLLNGKTLLALAGVAWGLYETATSQQGQPQAGGSPPAAPGGQAWPAPDPARSAPPPVPGSAPSAVPSDAPAQVPSRPPVPDGVRRVIQLTLSAARADGTLSDVERELKVAAGLGPAAEGFTTTGELLPQRAGGRICRRPQRRGTRLRRRPPR